MLTADPRDGYRGRGPRLFLSYSFSDAAFANDLSRALTALGARVTVVQRDSLVGEPLERSLADLIADCEVFVPLVTQAASSSEWVAREVATALAVEEAGGLRIAAVVLDDCEPPAPLAQRAYLRTASGTPGSIDALAADLMTVARRSVLCLRLLTERPFGFDSSDCSAALLGRADQRVIVDSDGLVLTILDEWTTYARSLPEIGQQYAEEIRQWRSSVEQGLDLVDRSCARLLAELRRVYQDWGTGFPDCAIEPLQRLARLRLSKVPLRLSDHPDREHVPTLDRLQPLTSYASEQIERARSRSRDSVERDFAMQRWALEKAGQLTEAPWRATELVPNAGKQSVQLLLPEYLLSGPWSERYGSWASPAQAMTEDQWAQYALPQIAAFTAVNALDAGRPETTGWLVTDYARLGAP